MSFRTRRVLYGTPLYMILDFIVLHFIFELFGGINDLITFIIVLFLGFIQAIPMLYEEKKSRKITRFLSTISGIWTWVLVMLIIYLLAINIIGLFATLSSYMLLFPLLLIVILGVYAYYNAHRIKIKEQILELDNLNEEYNIIHLSDVHFGSVRYKQIIEDLVQKIKEIEEIGDIVIISGDLADGSCVVNEDDFIEFKKIDIPVIFTSGNHDYYPGIENVHKACKKAGMIILENEGMTYKNLNIYGLSFSFGNIDMPSKEELLQFIDEDKVNIVNYHVPNGWDELAKIGFDIQLSGHTHGGQFYPIVNIGKYMYEGHNRGLFKKRFDEKTAYLHVTAGVGSMDIPMRWGTDSEIVILKLTNSKIMIQK